MFLMQASPNFTDGTINNCAHRSDPDTKLKRQRLQLPELPLSDCQARAAALPGRQR